MDSRQIKFIIASVSGNMLEWYDYSLYGYFAIILAKLFFPAKDDFTSLMITLGVFAGGFLTRPIGGIIFGHIGDKYGRRLALLVSVLLILLPTGLMGILPTYNSIGISATVALTILRLIQGIAVSGELIGAGTFLIECAPEKNRSFYGSLVMSSIYLGLLLGVTVSAIVSKIFTQDQLLLFAWRIPFIISFFLGIGTLWLRVSCEESPVFNKLILQANVLKLPVYDAVKNFPWQILLICLISSVLAIAIYLLIGYFPSYFVSTQNMSFNNSMQISFVGLLILTICVPIMGRVSDFVGHKKMLGIGTLCFSAFSSFIFYLAFKGDFVYSIFSVILTAVFLSPIASSLMFTISDSFPANVRYSGVAVGYNISMAIFGGTTPLIMMYFSKQESIYHFPSIYVGLCGLAAFFSLLIVNKKYSRNK